MKTRLWHLLLSVLCVAGLAFASAAPSMADDFTEEEIQQIIHDYLMDNPEVILEAVQSMQARQEAETAAQQTENLVALRDDIIGGPSTIIAGNPNGDVTLVEFFDYRCSYCRRVAPAVMTLVEQDPGVRFAMKEFPILGEESVYAARAALAADRQNMYWEMHTALIDFRGNYNEQTIRALANDLGMNADKLIVDMGGPDITAIIEQNYQLAQQLGINGTPAFIVGNTIVPGAISLEAMQDLIEQARQG